MTESLMEYIETGKMPKPLSLADTRKHYFGEKAKLYDNGRENSEKWVREHAAVTELLKETTGSLLDIPCGTGRFFQIYQDYGLDFTGMDVSEDMMCQARDKFPDAKVVSGDIMNIEREDKSVNSIVCIRLLNLMMEDEMVKAIKEMGRVAKDRIICSLFTGDQQERHNRHWVHRMNVYGQAVESAGFILSKCLNIRKPVYNVWLCVPG